MWVVYQQQHWKILLTYRQRVIETWQLCSLSVCHQWMFQLLLIICSLDQNRFTLRRFSHHQRVTLNKYICYSRYWSIKNTVQGLWMSSVTSAASSVCCCDLYLLWKVIWTPVSPAGCWAAAVLSNSTLSVVIVPKCIRGSLGILTSDLPVLVCPIWKIFSLHPSVPVQLSPVQLENRERSTSVCLGESDSAERHRNSHHSFFMVTVKTRLRLLFDIYHCVSWLG